MVEKKTPNISSFFA